MKSKFPKWYYKILIKGMTWFYLFLILGVVIFVFLCMVIQINGHALICELWM